MPAGSSATWHISPGLRRVRYGDVEGATYSMWLRLGSGASGEIVHFDDIDVRLSVHCGAELV